MPGTVNKTLYLTSMTEDSTSALTEFLKRLMPKQWNQFVLTVVPAPQDFFELSADGSPENKISVRANSAVAACHGIKYYLSHFCRCSVSWAGDNLSSLPSVLPRPASTVRKSSPHKYRYYLNYCTFGYSMAFWNWERWERELDLMALQGINLALMIVGQEAVWLNVLQKFGYTESEALSWISVPTHLPWQWMSNLQSFAGPIPLHWVQTHAELGLKIARRMRELGIQPVLQGYYGIAPSDFKSKNPTAKVLEQGIWAEPFVRPGMVDPTDPTFNTLAATFYAEQEHLLGKALFFAADPFHEGGNTKSVDVSEATRRIQAAMLAACKDSVWILQAWWENPLPNVLKALDKEKSMVLDLFCENPDQQAWETRDCFEHTKWVFCIIHDFGGNTGMFGDIHVIARNLEKAMSKAGSSGMCGVGAAMEGIEQNQIIYDYLYDSAWEERVPKPEEWAEEFLAARYGGLTSGMRTAWDRLLATVYGKAVPINSLTRGSIIVSKFTQPKKKLLYPVTELLPVWKAFVEAKGEAGVRSTPGLEHDLVTVGKQVLTMFALWAHRDIMFAETRWDVKSMRQSCETFQGVILDVDKLLSTRKEFLLGRWMKDAEGWATNKEEADLYKWSAKTLFTLWNAVPCSGLNDYARRELAGLVKDFYYVRWSYYLRGICKAAERNEKANDDQLVKDIAHWEKVWATQTEREYASEPVGDVWSVSKELYTKYAPMILARCGDSLTVPDDKIFEGRWEFVETKDKIAVSLQYDGKVVLMVDGKENCQWGKEVHWSVDGGNATVVSQEEQVIDVYTIADEGKTLVSHFLLLGRARRVGGDA